MTTHDLVEIVDAFFKGDNDARMALADVLEEAGKDGSAAFLRYGDVIAYMKRAEAACILHSRVWEMMSVNEITDIGFDLANLMCCLIDGRPFRVCHDDRIFAVVSDLFPDRNNLIWSYLKVVTQ
jgi:hypothetical protein